MSTRSSLLSSVPENLSLSFSGRHRRKAADNELRAEVEDIVEKVLPDEIDNVDQMLEEFYGREDELLKSLRRMQELNGATSGPVDPDDYILDGDDEEDEDEGGPVGFDVDQWQDDLDHQLDDSNLSQSELSEFLNLSNPQGGGALKSPPELLMAEAESNNYSAEEKKNDSPPPPANNLAHQNDEDENDVPPEEYMVQTNSMRSLKMSSLTTASMGGSDRSWGGSESSVESTSTKSTSTIPPGKKTVALVKLRVWDPANPKRRMECLTSTHIILPDQNEMDEVLIAADPQILQREDSAHSKSRKAMKRLSIVSEEPEKPPHRGDSYFDDNNISSGNNILKNMCEQALKAEEGDNASNIPRESSRAGLRVGTLVGIQGKTSSSSSSSKQTNSSYCPNRNYEWKAGNSIHLFKVNILPLSKLSELHYQMENDVSSLRELVMDGLPPSSFALEEAELIFEALGTNTSIKRLSMRYSNVNDDLASLFALVLVENTTLTQLSLEGNDMTNVSAKNFYSVLKKNNETLRLLDLRKNPMIDEDVELAVDQYMGQRALKRTLTNKAEKAKRAARGMPPDATLDEDDDEGDGQVTVVCPPSIIDDVIESGDETDYNQNGHRQQQHHEIPNDDSSGIVKPYPGEHFRDYMQRMDQEKENSNHTPSYHQKLNDDSMRERQAFDNFAALEPLSEEQPHYQYQQALGPPNSEPQNPLLNFDDSIGSSITTRSTHRPDPENDIITTTSNDHKRSYEPNKAVAGADRGAPTGRMSSVETLESVEGDGRTNFREPPGRMNSMDTHESANTVQIDPRMSTMAEASGPAPGAVYHNTQTSKGSHPSFEITNEDYMDDKAGERAIRRQLATQAGAIGAYHIDEAAPERQRRSAGRARATRTPSQRRARLAQLSNIEDGTGNSPVADVGAGGDSSNEPVIYADIERANDMFPHRNRRASRLSRIGLGDEDSGTDRIVCGILGLLLVGLLVMIIILMVR